MDSGRTPVLLLKTKSSPTDAYEDYFSNPSNGAYDARFVPVLDHRFTDDGTAYMRECVENGSFSSAPSAAATEATPYGGLVFTSQRAVEAFTQVVQDLRSKGVSMQDCIPKDMPVYVVGPATARGVRALDLPCCVLGEDTGNGDALAAFILDHYNANRPVRISASSEASEVSAAEAVRPGLLFPVGEQRRDIISRTLQAESLPEASRIPVVELTVYETAVMHSFEAQFAREIQPALRQARPQWIVVFSPTGCRAMLEGLGLLTKSSTGKLAADARAPGSLSRTALIASIGPTTRDYLVREFGLEPDVCSSKPSPDGLGSSIAEFEAAHPQLVS